MQKKSAITALNAAVKNNINNDIINSTYDLSNRKNILIAATNALDA